MRATSCFLDNRSFMETALVFRRISSLKSRCCCWWSATYFLEQILTECKNRSFFLLNNIWHHVPSVRILWWFIKENNGFKLLWIKTAIDGHHFSFYRNTTLRGHRPFRWPDNLCHYPATYWPFFWNNSMCVTIQHGISDACLTDFIT